MNENKENIQPVTTQPETPASAPTSADHSMPIVEGDPEVSEHTQEVVAITAAPGSTPDLEATRPHLVTEESTTHLGSATSMENPTTPSLNSQTKPDKVGEATPEMGATPVDLSNADPETMEGRSKIQRAAAKLRSLLGL